MNIIIIIKYNILKINCVKILKKNILRNNWNHTSLKCAYHTTTLGPYNTTEIDERQSEKTEKWGASGI